MSWWDRHPAGLARATSPRAEEAGMGKIIVIQFVTIDGVVEDPDGRAGTPFGGWMFRFGPETIAGDRFGIAPILRSGALLLGRRSWEHFARLWPTRTDPFAETLNAVPKVVVSRGTPDLAAWSNSRLLDEDLVVGAKRLAQDHDIVVMGSLSVARELAAAGLVDEYRLMTFPTAVGEGARLFVEPADLELVSVEAVGPTMLATYAAG
jgi:dihydrofolate reductase